MMNNCIFYDIYLIIYNKFLNIEEMERTLEKSTYQQIITSNILNQRFQFISIIGKGCFGKVYKVFSKVRNEEVALKIQEKQHSKGHFLYYEYERLDILQGISGVPQIFSFGQYQFGHYLEMQLLQGDLNTNKTYSLSQITHLTIELLTIFCEIHKRQVIHQDIKPNNIMKSKEGKYYIIDFGLSKVQKKQRQKYIRSFIGTPRYASIAAHQMYSQSKKDDLESLFYNIAYLYYKKLPWSKLFSQGGDKLEKIKVMKISCREKLFQQMGLTFYKAFQYITGLQDFEMPNYKLLIGYFKRHKTVLEKVQTAQDISKKQNKRLSLNTNYLQVPQNPYRPKRKSVDSTERNSARSISSASIYTDMIIKRLISANQILQTTAEQNLNLQFSMQPVVYKIKNISCNFFEKNPFTCPA